MSLKKLPESINGIKVIKCLGMNNEAKRKRIALFRCECGNEFAAKVNAVSNGHKKSCGCIRGLSNLSHGMSKHTLYRKWSGMITRCENKNENHWHRYGGRGISICKEWRNDFLSFYKWAIDNGWKEGLTIDRINNDGNYEPTNCQWITMVENTLKDSNKFCPTNEQIKDIIDLYLIHKKTVTEISEIYKAWKGSISKILKNNNIKISKKRRKDNGL